MPITPEIASFISPSQVVPFDAVTLGRTSGVIDSARMDEPVHGNTIAPQPVYNQRVAARRGRAGRTRDGAMNGTQKEEIDNDR
jgi:hypothetical protein